MANERGKAFSDGALDAEVAEVQAATADANTAAAAANAVLAQIEDAGSDAELHAQSTGPFTDSNAVDFDNGAKGYAAEAEASNSAAEGWADVSAVESGEAQSAASAAAASAATAVAAANATGPITIFATKAAANTGLAGVAANAFVEVQVDESLSNRRTRYQKVAGSYVFVLYMPSIVEVFYDATDYGAAGGSDSRDAIQDAVDAAFAAGGGTVVIPPASAAYELTAIAHPFQASAEACIELKSGVSLCIRPGAVLELADGQQTDAGGPVDLIVFEDAQDIHIYGGGTIRGNTAGQTGWTGGYAQVTNGCLIRSRHTDTTSARITVEDLYLEDHWSNPVEIHAVSDVTLRNLRCLNCGEGPQVNSAVRVQILHSTYHDTTDVIVGDGFELSGCDDWLIEGCEVTASAATTGGGSGFDIHASPNGTLRDFRITNWKNGLIVQRFTGPETPSANVIVENGALRGVAGIGIVQGSTSSPGDFDWARTVYRNILIEDCGSTGIFVRAYLSTNEPAIFENVTVRGGAGYGLHIAGPYTVAEAINCRFEDNTDHGVYINREGDDNGVTFIMRGGCSTGNGGNGITATNEGQSTWDPPVITIHGADLRGNTGRSFFGDDLTAAQHAAVSLEHVASDEITSGWTNPSVAGAARLINPGFTVSTIGAGSVGQLLPIQMTSGSRDVNDVDGTIELVGDTNVTLTTGSRIVLRYDADGVWREEYRAIL